MVKLSKVPAFGFLKDHNVIGSKKMTPSAVLSHNLRKTVGYIPGLSLIQGIEHLVRALKHKNEYSAHFIFRSIVEMLSLGFLLLIPDLIVTCVREQKSISGNLQARNIIPLPSAKPVVNRTFPEKVEQFVRPPAVKPPRDPKVELIKKQIRKLVELNQKHKIEGYLERSQLDLTHKASIESLKQFVLKEPKMAEPLVHYLYIRGALTDSIEDVEFYKNLGIALIEADMDATELCQNLYLDLDQEYCLKAVTAIAKAHIKQNPDAHKQIQLYGIGIASAARRLALEEIAYEAIKHDPHGTLQNLEVYDITEPLEIEAIKKLAHMKGSLEQRKEAAIKLAKISSEMLDNNWLYFDFDVTNEQEKQAAHEVMLVDFLSNSLPKIPSVHTDEGLAFVSKLALEIGKQDYHCLKKLINVSGLSLDTHDHRELLKNIGLACLKDHPWGVWQDAHLFGLEKTVVQDEIKKLNQLPLANKQALLSEVIEKSPGVFFELSPFILSGTPKELQLQEELTIRLSKKGLSFLESHPYESTTLKKLLLAAASSANHQEAANMLHTDALEALGISKTDYGFYCSLACILAKKTNQTLTYFQHYFQAKTEKGFPIMREIGLSLAALDGKKFKQDWKYLGFDIQNEQHAAALKEMIQLAIADDGDISLESFGKLAPAPSPQTLTIKQACNLIAIHASKQNFNPKHFLDKVLTTELQSNEGRALMLQLIAHVAPIEAQVAQRVCELLPLETKKQAAFVLLPHLHDGKQLENLLLEFASHEHLEILRSLLAEFIKQKGLAKLSTLVKALDPTYSRCWLIIKEIAKLSPHEGAYIGGILKDDNERLLKLGEKQGTPEERLAAALKEASFPDDSIIKNLPYYHLSNPLPVLAKNFSVNPNSYLYGKEFSTLMLDWPDAREVFLKGAKKMKPELLLFHVGPLLKRHAHESKGQDPNFHFELAKVIATKSIKKLPISKLDLTEKQKEEVVKIGYKENQSFTFKNLDKFGVKADRQASLEAELKQIEMTGSINERGRKAIKAIERNPEDFLSNMLCYFSPKEILQQEVPQEVAQAYLNASGNLSSFIYFNIYAPLQIEKMIQKAAQTSHSSNKFLDLNALEDTLKLDLTLPADRQRLFTILLLLAEKHPVQVVKMQLPLQLSCPEDLAYLTALLKKLTAKNTEFASKMLASYKWDFRKLDQVVSLTSILKEIAKKVGLTFPFWTDNWKAEKIKHALYEEVPAKYVAPPEPPKSNVFDYGAWQYGGSPIPHLDY